MTKPNFLIIGAQKAGSDRIAEILKKHENVFIPESLEPQHFSRIDCEDPDRVKAYLKQFDDAGSTHEWVGEHTSGYFWSSKTGTFADQPPKSHNPDIPGSVSRILGPDTRMIVALCHPVYRAISAYIHHGRRKRISEDQYLRDVVGRLGIADIGFYEKHLEAWERVFPAEQIQAVIFESEIASNPYRGLKLICDFLQIDSEGFRNLSLKINNANEQFSRHDNRIATGISGLNDIRPDDVAYLLDLYAPTLKALHERFGDRLASWKAETELLQHFAREKSWPGLAGRKTGTIRAELSPVRAALTGRKQLARYGVDVHPDVVARLPEGLMLEPPARIYQATFRGKSSMGAFSYTVSGAFYTTDIGRYCSIASAINIGQGNHPMDFLSTHPAFFQGSFKIATGDKYPYKKHYDADRVVRSVARAAHKATAARTRIGHDVWIGHGASVISGVRIGDGAVIGANAVVTKDVPPYAVVGGVPAKIIRYRFPEEIIGRLLASEWWSYAPWQMRHIDFSNIGKAVTAVEKMRQDGVEPYVPDRVEIVWNSEEALPAAEQSIPRRSRVGRLLRAGKKLVEEKLTRDG
ncbi:DapH/DapD/GlmU-related protein [Paracoccus aerodenitrificans]|uniref:DapH/DapD/GlmU-related protein n=1 Tax=Paracoccus aerodenitrificans TaxID=3017781 RepID=UPI0022F113DF|nr:DapH/DapD/GlmU-related protein [Paracoccus aerodenitrificans]WBU62651.1 sulfotransferase [Paracoccus aerodenitrificans]